MDNIKPSEISDIDELIAKYSPFLAEIRKRILIILVGFVIGSVFGFVFYENIIRFLIELLSLNGVNIVFTSPFQFINLAINCGIATGLVLTFPLIIYELLSFLKPALKHHEYNLIIKFLPLSIVLFVAGFSFGIFVMKWQIQLFLTQSVSLGIGNILDVSRLMGTVLTVSSLLGIAFQFPIVLFLLIRIGIIEGKTLAKQRLWVYLGAVLFAILLPLDSLLADALLALPLIVLFELSLMMNRLYERKNLSAVRN